MLQCDVDPQYYIVPSVTFCRNSVINCQNCRYWSQGNLHKYKRLTPRMASTVNTSDWQDFTTLIEVWPLNNICIFCKPQIVLLIGLKSIEHIGNCTTRVDFGTGSVPFTYINDLSFKIIKVCRWRANVVAQQ